MYFLQYLTLQGDKSEVISLCSSPDKKHLAVGYNDGTVKIFSLITGEATVVFSGHKSTVTALAYDSSGLRLMSGARVSYQFFSSLSAFTS